MSDWKVIKTSIEVFPHPNAEKLQLAKVGTYQVVVQKGLYSGGEKVLFAPEKSVLTGHLESEFKTYLAGANKDRVKSIALRGEMSCGIILSDDLVRKQCGVGIDELPDGVDLSEKLGITRYVAPIPVHLAGEVETIPDGVIVGKHDCEQIGVYASNLVQDERVVITEKLHGSQMIAYLHQASGARFVTSKGFMDKGQCLTVSTTNAYWRASQALWPLIESTFGPDVHVQVFGELVPCQGQAWSYGFKDPTIRVFDVRVDGKSVPYDTLDEAWRSIWVPILYDGPYDEAKARSFREGKEQVTGRQEHIREGAVLRPYIDRRAADGTRLALKIINPAYKETGEEFN
jgi:RNA ligase (TIGR02306 family)